MLSFCPLPGRASDMRLNKSFLGSALIFSSIAFKCPLAFSQAKDARAPQAPTLLSQVDKGTILQGGDSTSPFTNKPISPEKGNEPSPETAPGADSVMTPSLLLVSPINKGSAQANEPLKAFIGQSLILKVEDSNINIGSMHGIMISVVNDTSRPLVLDGDNAKVTIDSQTVTCAPLIALQRSVLPKHDAKTMTAEVFTKLIPAALSVGLVPTIRDIKTIRKPIRERYGPDERRRLMEASRFGKRILWPHQQTKGVVYFQDIETIAGSKLEMSVHTLFDIPDCTIIGGVI